jgi:hypothetical protein
VNNELESNQRKWVSRSRKMSTVGVTQTLTAYLFGGVLIAS